MSSPILETSQQEELSGILVAYRDDNIDDSVNSALRRKARVRYRCFDTYSSFLAFGTSSGAIYLFRLEAVTHSTCELSLKIPCDQGSIEVIKFLPSPQAEDLLVVIGTSRGSIVVFRLLQIPGENSPVCNEIYRAESFTNNAGIKFIEIDQDLFDSTYPFDKLYICDVSDRLYVLRSSSIHAYQQTIRIFQSNHIPCYLPVPDLKMINQISVHRSQLLISTEETTRLYDEQSNQLYTIGTKKRRRGFYGACFFNPNYRPARMVHIGAHSSQLSMNQSTRSLAELESLLIFVARPMFRLWQVNHRLSVMLTHQFEPLIRSSNASCNIIELDNAPISDPDLEDPEGLMESLAPLEGAEGVTGGRKLKSDHFHKLALMYSSTLGNLILSYTQHELYVIDPIGAKLVVCHSQESPIVQICSNENELFIWSLTTNGEPNQFHLRRLVLLAPTQFVLELHRMHRYQTLVMFVQQYADLFRHRMALPLAGPGVITTEGGLLRNVLLNAWDMYESRRQARAPSEDSNDDSDSDEASSSTSFGAFKSIIDEIIAESRQLRQSLENVTDSRFFLTMTTENIDRLCSEPYTSLVSLQVSIADLHTNHVIHFSKDALNRHKSVANLSQNLSNINNIRQITQSNFDLSDRGDLQQNSANDADDGALKRIADNKVIVERRRPNKPKGSTKASKKTVVVEQATLSAKEQPFFSAKRRDEVENSTDELEVVDKLDVEDLRDPGMDERNVELGEDPERRCSNCRWPRARCHLRRLDSSQYIQLRWIEENLMSKFEENVEQLEEKAFKHGLWDLFLRCLAFRNQTNDYITCCIMLDDVHLLDMGQLVITRSGEEELMDCLLAKLSRKIELELRVRSAEADSQPGNSRRYICLKCESEWQSDKDPSVEDYDQFGGTELQSADQDEISFNLVNLLEQFMMRRSADISKVIDRLLRYPKLLNGSKIPTTFYLKAIAASTLVANQSPLSRVRLNQLRGSTGVANS